MKINKLNYEAFLLDYLENQLNEPLRSELLAFVKAHPELDIDLQNWDPVYVQPDLSIQFPDTTRLLKPVSVKPVRRRIRPVYWVSLAAAVLAGALLIALFLIPQKTGVPIAPIVLEEQPVKKVITPIIDNERIEQSQEKKIEERQVVGNEDEKPTPKQPKALEANEPVVPEEVVEVPEPMMELPDETESPEPIEAIVENPEPAPKTPAPSPIPKAEPKQEEVVAEVNAPQPKEEVPEVLNKQPIEETIVADVPKVELTVTPAEPVAEVTIEHTEKQTLAELDVKEKKKKKLFPRFKERFGNGKLTSAFLPEAYGGE